jgi:hypothetical protein
MKISYADLEEKLIHTPYCHLCKPRGLHQFCEIVFDEERT